MTISCEALSPLSLRSPAAHDHPLSFVAGDFQSFSIASFCCLLQGFMDLYAQSPFHKFRGWRLLALIFIFMVYTLWFTGPGYFGDMTRIAGHISLQESGFYSGATAVDILGKLDSAGRKTKYLALVFDVPYMIMQTLVFEALIAFGIRHMRPKNTKWNLLFMLPIAFLFADFAEDSFIGLTLASGSEIFGTIAGFMTAFKFLTFIPSIVVALAMTMGGLTAWMRRRKLS